MLTKNRTLLTANYSFNHFFFFFFFHYFILNKCNKKRKNYHHYTLKITSTFIFTFSVECFLINHRYYCIAFITFLHVKKTKKDTINSAFNYFQKNINSAFNNKYFQHSITSTAKAKEEKNETVTQATKLESQKRRRNGKRNSTILTKINEAHTNPPQIDQLPLTRTTSSLHPRRNFDRFNFLHHSTHAFTHKSTGGRFVFT